jgi:hypothetical protein
VKVQCDGQSQCSLFGCYTEYYGLNALFGDPCENVEKVAKVQYTCV